MERLKKSIETFTMEQLEEVLKLVAKRVEKVTHDERQKMLEDLGYEVSPTTVVDEKQKAQLIQLNIEELERTRQQREALGILLGPAPPLHSNTKRGSRIWYERQEAAAATITATAAAAAATAAHDDDDGDDDDDSDGDDLVYPLRQASPPAKRRRTSRQ